MKILRYGVALLLVSSGSLCQNQELNIEGINISKGNFNTNEISSEKMHAFVPQTNCIAVLKTREGKVYKHVSGRIDLTSAKFIFTVDQQDFICTAPVMQVVFDSCDKEFEGAIFETGYPTVDKQNNSDFYKVLVDGKATLLKYYAADQTGDKLPYNSAGSTPLYKYVEYYYLYMDWQMFRLGRNNKNLTRILSISPDYIDKQKLNLKNEPDIIKLVKYYNSSSQ